MPVEFVLMGYPVLNLPPLPDVDVASEGSEADADGPDPLD
jgi:hypothetical protein